MARVRMLRHCNFTPVETPRLLVELKADRSYTIKESWATQLEFLGVVERAPVPPRQAAPAAKRKPRARRARSRSPKA